MAVKLKNKMGKMEGSNTKYSTNQIIVIFNGFEFWK